MTTGTPKKTTAHSAAQLQRALGFDPDRFARARAAGLIPPPDLKTPRWSGTVVDTLTARRDEILAGLPDDADADQLAAALGLSGVPTGSRSAWI